MANPQKENGYTPIANEILDALCRIRISGEARQVLDVILRKTYGFNKKEDRIALSQLCLGTGLKKSTICKAITKLIVMNLVTKKGNDTGSLYRFNKDFDTWKPLPKKVTLPKKEKVITKKGNNRYPKRDIQKTITKDTFTKDTRPLPFKSGPDTREESFNRAYDMYGKKVARAAAWKSWKKIEEKDHPSIFAAIPKHNALPDNRKEGGKYKPYFSTWLNQRRWEDELQSSAAPPPTLRCKACGKDASSNHRRVQGGVVHNECFDQPVNQNLQSLKAGKEIFKSMPRT